MPEIKYPRRQVVRYALKGLIHAAFWALTDLEIEGGDRVPEQGPMIIAGNHFSYADSVAMIRLAPPTIEFFAGSNPAFTPTWAEFLPKLWGVFYVRRGSVSRKALRAAVSVLSQGGLFGIFPEGGAWAEMLRPARPGLAYLAARTGAPVLPVAFTGFRDVFPIRLRNQAEVKIKIGTPIGPFRATGRGRERREQLDEIGEEIMRAIAQLLPDELRGKYSSDPAVREAARKVADYPWENADWDEV
ncbi:MAG: lysophospholipid acyltransferase family protein [Chloroflexota bacterium]